MAGIDGGVGVAGSGFCTFGNPSEDISCLLSVPPTSAHYNYPGLYAENDFHYCTKSILAFRFDWG